MVGSHMADLLLTKNYEIYGTSRNIDTVSSNLLETKDKIKLIQADLNDHSSIHNAIEVSRPDEIYNFGAVSFAPSSWVLPEYTANVNGVGVLKILEAIKQVDKNIKLYQASTSEIFGNLKNTTVNEDTVPHPKSPYGIAKLYAQWTVKNYRETYDMFVCSGISFNHESERRGVDFVTRKITKSVAEISLGKKDYLELGNLNISKDWGYTPDYVQAMWGMLQSKKADDYIIATNTSHTIQYVLEVAFKYVGISNYMQYIKVNPEFIRVGEVGNLTGDYSKIQDELGWKPVTPLKTVIELMVKKDLDLINKY